SCACAGNSALPGMFSSLSGYWGLRPWFPVPAVEPQCRPVAACSLCIAHRPPADDAQNATMTGWFFEDIFRIYPTAARPQPCFVIQITFLGDPGCFPAVRPPCRI